MIKKYTPGCGSSRCTCSTSCGTIKVTVKCGSNTIAGATVTATLSGTVVASGTTDSSGVVTLTITSAGSYTITASATGAVTGSTTVSATCTANSVTLGLAAATGYTCSPCCTGATGGAPFLDPTWPTTLYVNDGIGTVPVTLVQGGAAPVWLGSADRASSLVINCPAGSGSGAGNARIYYEVTCTTVAIAYFSCTGAAGIGTGCSGPSPAISGSEDTSYSAAATGCNGASATLTGPTGWGAIASISIPCSGTVSASASVSGGYNFYGGANDGTMWYVYSQIYGSATGGYPTGSVSIPLLVTS